MTSRAPNEPKASHLAHVLFACAKEQLANAPKAEAISFVDAVRLTEAMTVQQLYDQVRKTGCDPAKVAILIGPVNDARGYPIPFNLRMLAYQSGNRGTAIILKTDGL